MTTQISAPTGERSRDRVASLQAEEISRATAVLRADGVTPTAVVSVTLHEPDPAQDAPRAAEIVWIEQGVTHEALVDLSGGQVLWRRPVPAGHAAFVPSEAALVDRLVRTDARFVAALMRRGLVPDQVDVGLFPAGNRVHTGEADRRLFRTSCWLRGDARPYSTPVEGIVALVDVGAGTVLEVHDSGVVAVPPPTIDYRPERLGPPRTGLRPLQIIQPEGESFQLQGNVLSWQGWSMALGFTPREGLVLHDVTYRDGVEERPIMRRASLSEMVVPYAHPGPGHYDRAVFDVGEGMLGLCANELALGCDCLGVIRYLDAVVNDEAGEPRTITNAICIHEEDEGILWKHTDADGRREVRRSRRLVVSWFATLDNYDYGFYWYFRQDGSIEMEVKLTGIVLVEAVGEDPDPASGPLVAPQRSGILHQHFFCFRLHMDVDGGPNELVEEQAEPLPVGPENPYGNAFRTRSRQLHTEHEARRSVDPARARRWKIRHASRRNALGQPTAYELVGGDFPHPLAAVSSAFMRRSGFVAHSLWATPYQSAERFAAGEHPNLHPGGAGLPEWTAGDRSLGGGDLVLWHTVGVHHYSRPEDWPVMPVARVGFMIKPAGFFDHNPANDLPAPTPAHAGAASCGCHGDSAGSGSASAGGCGCGH